MKAFFTVFHVVRFLTIPQNASESLSFLINDIKKSETEKPFLFEFIKRNGMPKWESITSNFPLERTQNNNESSGIKNNSSEFTNIAKPDNAFIPLIDTITGEVSSYIYYSKAINNSTKYFVYNKKAVLSSTPSGNNDIKTKAVVLSVFAHFEMSINKRESLSFPLPYKYNFTNVNLAFSDPQANTSSLKANSSGGCVDGHIYLSLPGIFSAMTGGIYTSNPCDPKLHFVIHCQNGSPLSIPPSIDDPCGKLADGGNSSGSTNPPTSSLPPVTVYPTDPNFWLTVFPSPYQDPGLNSSNPNFGSTNPNPSNYGLPSNWQEDPDNPWFETSGRTEIAYDSPFYWKESESIDDGSTYIDNMPNDEPYVYFDPSDGYENKYPRFTSLVKNLKKFVKSNPKVLSALQKWSGFSKQEIIEKLVYKVNNGPKIKVKLLSGTYGHYNHINSPGVLDIDEAVVKGLEISVLESTKQGTAFLLAVTILHEFVHFGENVNGVKNTGSFEFGNEFEKQAFSVIINTSNANGKSIQFKKIY